MTNAKQIGELFSVFSAHMSDAEFKSAIINAQISARIAKERIDRGMTQKEFAEFLGVSQPMVSKWEAGNYNFTISAVSSIFDKLGLDYIFHIKEEQSDFTINYEFPCLKKSKVIDFSKYSNIA